MTRERRDEVEAFLRDAGADLSTFEAATARLRAAGELNEDELGVLTASSTRLRGAAEQSGFGQIARLAGFAERLLSSAPRLSEGEFGTLLSFFEQLAACLRGAVGRVAVGDGEGALGLELAQLGGTELLLSLLRKNPEAFVHAPAPSGAAGRNVALQLSGSYALGTALRAFYLEHREDWSFFAPEVREQLSTMRALLAELRAPGTSKSSSEPSSEAALTALFRALHTVKGTAYMVGLESLGHVTHRLEDLLETTRKTESLGESPFDAHVVRVLELGMDVLDEMLSSAEGRGEALPRMFTRLEQALASPASLDDPASADPNPEDTNQEPADARVPEAPALPEGSVRLSLSRVERLTELTDELVGIRTRLERELEQIAELGPLLTLTQRYLRRLTRERPAVSAAPVSVPPLSATPATLLAASAAPVPAFLQAPELESGDVLYSRLEELASDVGEVEAQLGTLLRTSADELKLLGQTSRTLRAEVGRARRVRMAVLFERLSGLLEGRTDVLLETRGEATEVDARVLAGLTEPLLHLVRNALAHAAEPSAVRLKAGKEAALKLSLGAKIESRKLVLVVEDDGPGVDTSALRHAAVERGLRSPEDAEALSEEAALELMFVSGLSTAAEVDVGAGRGVGMDAALAGMTRLSGTLSVTTQPGQGTRFQLVVPLSRSVSDALFVGAGGHSFALPLGAVELLVAASPEALASAQLTIEDTPVPLLRLTQLLGLSPTVDPGLNSVARFVPNAVAQGELISLPLELPTVVLKTAETRYGLVVESLAATAEVVIKDAGELLEGLNYLAGMTVSGTGRVTPLLEPDGLWGLAQGVTPEPAATLTPTQAPPLVLVVDDSVSVRRLLSKALTREGYTVVTAADGQEALEYVLAGKSVDAVLTDLEMPRLDGFRLTEWLRAHPPTAALAICVMSTRASAAHAEHAAALGADAYLTKPVTTAQLLDFLTRTRAR